MQENLNIDKERIKSLIESLSDANAQRVLIYIQGLQAGQNLIEKKSA